MTRIMGIIALFAALAGGARGEDAPAPAPPPSELPTPARTAPPEAPPAPCIESPAGGADAASRARLAQAAEGLQAACASLLGKDDRAALHTLELALSSAPDHAGAYLHRALARARLGDAAGAAADYREALKHPKEAVPREPARCLCDATLAEEERALAERRRASEASRKRGVELFLAGDGPAALAAFDRALQDEPGEPEAHASRAVARAAVGNPAGAASDYESAFRSGSAAGRWDLAADASLAWARLPGADGRPSTGALAALADLLKMAEPGWARRDELGRELKRLEGAKRPEEKRTK